MLLNETSGKPTGLKKKLKTFEGILCESVKVNSEFIKAAEPLIKFLKTKSIEKLSKKTRKLDSSKPSKSDLSKPVYKKLLPLIRYFLVDIIHEVEQKVPTKTKSMKHNWSELTNCQHIFHNIEGCVNCSYNPCECMDCILWMRPEDFHNCCGINNYK